MTGRVLRIEKCSIHDGDGLRAVVFLKGCPLRCAWCASPESWDGVVGSGYGAEMTEDAVVSEIAKDDIFYFHSGGGVTISGGEPLSQPRFTRAILEGCKRLGIHTAMETCAYGAYADLEMLLPCLDLIYADIKLIDDAAHIKWTGASNAPILDNIRRVSQYFDGRLRIRLPLVPTVNMDDGFLQAAAAYCRGLPALDAVELLPYHRLGAGTYSKFNLEYAPGGIAPPGADAMARARDVFRLAAPNIRLV